MVIVAKYLSLLESLDFTDVNNDSRKTSPENLERVTLNLTIIRNCVKLEGEKLLEAQVSELKIEEKPPLQLKNKCITNAYCLHMKHLLLQLMNNINFDSGEKEELVSARHLNLCILAIQDLSHYALYQQLHPLILTNGLLANKECENVNRSIDVAALFDTIELFEKILLVKQFHVSNAMVSVLRDFMAAIYTLFVIHSLKEYTLSDENRTQLQKKLDTIWFKITKTEYFRNILMFKGCRQLPNDVQKRLHRELLQKLCSQDGFTTLVATLAAATQHTETQNSKQTFEIVANIVAFKGHAQRFQQNMLGQIFNFIQLCLKHTESIMLENMGAGLLALRKLYELNKNNQDYVKTWIENLVMQLITPVDMLSGLILMEHEELSLIICKLYHLFCTSIVECLPSNILIPYLPMLLQLFESMPPSMLERKQLTQLVIRCLSNRTPEHLHIILGKLYRQEYDIDWHQLHTRILIQPTTKETVCVKIAPGDYKQDYSISLSLPELLLNSSHNILTYQVFMSLLQHIDECLQNDIDEDQLDLLQTQEELVAFLQSKYPIKVELLLSLNTLVANEGLKYQLAENSADFLNVLKKFVSKRINTESTSSKRESADQTLLIMLTITQEVIEYTQLLEQLADLVPKLRSLKTQTPNQLVKHRIDCLLKLLDGKSSTAKNANNTQLDGTLFYEARSLIESKENHLQVYGIQNLLKLLRAHDSVTLANTHVILALALTTLKNKESYTFLNCVRLFVALLDVMEVEVLELLSDEYLNDQASLDQRLVIGEAILKVCKELGPLSHKYKDVLLNCFMYGARSSNDEFRWSSYSNLSQLCRTLSYQVHNFFHELINLIDSELTTGYYLPTKRAAVLVISELLEGMENLIDFEEMLLPLYRLLRAIESNDSYDEMMRVHAANGLKALSHKCNKLLFPTQTFEKPIQILGIKKEQPKIFTTL